MNTNLNAGGLAYNKDTAEGYNTFGDGDFKGDVPLFEALDKIGLKDKVVLDYGCGNGRLEKKLSSFEPKKIIGTEISEPMLATARLAVEALPSEWADKIEFYHVAGTETPFEDETFDVVIAHFIFHYIQDTAPTLRELHRVLKPNSVLVATFNDFSFTAGNEHLANAVVQIVLKKTLRLDIFAKPGKEIYDNALAAGFAIEKFDDFDNSSATVDPSNPDSEKLIFNNTILVARKL